MSRRSRSISATSHSTLAALNASGTCSPIRGTDTISAPTICYDCSTSGAPKPVAPLDLASGDMAHVLMRWHTYPYGGRQPLPRVRLVQRVGQFRRAVQFGDTETGIYYGVTAPTLLTTICSTVSADAYLPGPYRITGADVGGFSGGTRPKRRSPRLRRPLLFTPANASIFSLLSGTHGARYNWTAAAVLPFSSKLRRSRVARI